MCVGERVGETGWRGGKEDWDRGKEGRKAGGKHGEWERGSQSGSDVVCIKMLKSNRSDGMQGRD